MLVRYPDEIFDNLVGISAAGPYKIAFRPSMVRFLGGPTELELAFPSHAPRSAHLSVRVILLLLTLGVPLEASLHLVDTCCHRAESAARRRSSSVCSRNTSRWSTRCSRTVIARCNASATCSTVRRRTTTGAGVNVVCTVAMLQHLILTD